MVSGCDAPPSAEEAQVYDSVVSPLVAQRIIITPAMVQPDGVRPTLGAYQNLYDEQTLIGDPRGPWTYRPATTWGNVAYNENQYPMGFVIDLGQLYDVTQVGVFDTYDNPPRKGYVYFSVGAPGAWTSLPALLTNKWEQWPLVDVKLRTRYLHFARNIDGASNELVVYGTPSDGTPANAPPTVSAGADQTVVLPVSSAQLTGTASDSDGQVVSLKWVNLNGPPGSTLTGGTTLSATASGLVEGLYEFELQVTDDDGVTVASRTKVKVEPSPATRGRVQWREKTATQSVYGHFLYLPPGYDEGSNWPIVFFLHGQGQQGNGDNELQKLSEQALPNYIVNEGKDYPFVIVAPQTTGFWSEYEAGHELNWFIDRMLPTLKVNPKRVYLTGLSMGGAGTFNYAGLFPRKLAAAIPICTGGWGSSAPMAQAMVDGELPLWASHARNDSTIGYRATANWFDLLGQAMGGTGSVLDTYTSPAKPQTAFFRPALGKWQWIDGQTATDTNGLPPAKPMMFTLFDSGDHYIWGSVYKDPKVFAWMLAQQRP
ncbi:PKD domain-containing protein [Myxococcus stipitatus]|uniref:carboxylesterase family protein n=1 Tax=Myxococcus stipitatus TaxID=83455 RepID=UPI0030CD1BFB